MLADPLPGGLAVSRPTEDVPTVVGICRATVPLGERHTSTAGVESVVAIDEVGFDVDGELGESVVVLDFAKAAFGVEHPGGGPAQAHLLGTPVLDVALDRADGPDHRFARIARLQHQFELAGDPEAGDGQRLLHPLAE